MIKAGSSCYLRRSDACSNPVRFKANAIYVGPELMLGLSVGMKVVYLENDFGSPTYVMNMMSDALAIDPK